jgi:hypothetical protein
MVILRDGFAPARATRRDEYPGQNWRKDMTERAVVVTTEFRGVFFGYAEDTSGDAIRLKRARNCIYWSKATGGFMGLAATGPAKGSRIGATADVDLRKVTAVLEASPEAVQAWEAAETYLG